MTGTDTGVGKTAVACGLVTILREAGKQVGVLKPVETGCDENTLAPLDALALSAAAGYRLSGFPGEGEALPPEAVVPWRFRDPLAPEDAARLEGAEVGVDKIYQAMDAWMERADMVVVETAGGLLVPLNSTFNNADLIRGMELPVAVAAENRLGVINHTLLTLEALRTRGLTPICVVLSDISPDLDESCELNQAAISRHGKVPVYRVARNPEDPADEAARCLKVFSEDILMEVERELARVSKRY